MPISAGKWCKSFAAIVLSVIIAIVAVNYAFDFYGLYRDVKGRKLKVYSNERKSKYLFGYRYIPANFDGILIGASASITMDVSKIEGAHVYNASVTGANISEEKLIADNVFSRGKMKLAIFLIHPYLTLDHGRKMDYMIPREYWGGLGSIGLVRVYIRFLGAHFGLFKDRYDENGVMLDFEDPSKKTGADYWLGAGAAKGFILQPVAAQKNMASRKAIFVDETAFAEYAQLVKIARDSGAKVIGLILPLSPGTYAAEKDDLDAYFKRVSALFRSDEKVVNFNIPAYASFLRDPETFYDGVHMSRKAVDFITSEFAVAIRSRDHMSIQSAVTK